MDKVWEAVRDLRSTEGQAREGLLPELAAQDILRYGEDLGMALAASRRPEQGNIFS